MKTKIGHCLAVLGVLASVNGAHAATRSWDGGGATPDFSDPFNWDGDLTAPVSGTDPLEIGPSPIGEEPLVGFDTGEFRAPSFTFLSSAIAPYRVTTENSINDFLTLTGSGTTLLNASPVRHRFELITLRAETGSQTWDGGSQGLVLAQVDLGTSQALIITGTGSNAATRNEIVGTITGSAGLTKAGGGTLLLNNSSALLNDFTGATTLLAGTLQLGASDQIPDSSTLVLSGGVFDTGGFSDTIGALSLQGTTTIDFGTSNDVSLFFSDSHLELWGLGTLNILNFTAGADLFRFGSSASGLTAAQLERISFNGTAAMISSAGFVAPVPEPGVSVALLCGLAGLASRRRRRTPASAA